MKTLILYATKHGAVREIAERIAKRLEDSTVCDLSSKNIPSVGQYDCVVVGSSLYVGTIRKEAKEFLTKNTAVLLGKTVGLFLSGLSKDSVETYYTNNFPENLLKHAKATAFLSGKFDPKKSGFGERLIMKAVAKTAGYTDTISDEEIARFAEALTK